MKDKLIIHNRDGSKTVVDNLPKPWSPCSGHSCSHPSHQKEERVIVIMRDVFNADSDKMESFERVVNDLYHQFEYLQNRPAQIHDYDRWRESVKEKYPLDYGRILRAVSDKAQQERQAS